VRLKLLSEEEARCAFGEIDDLLEAHRSLRDNLSGLRDLSGITRSVGETLLKWVSFGNYAYYGMYGNILYLTKTEGYFLDSLSFQT
jgi:hypothetical protein